MADISKINKINSVIADFFKRNSDINKIQAKELMPDFIRAGIFKSNHRDGLPIRNLLRDLDSNNQLKLIPSLHPERKEKNTNWFFIRSSATLPLKQEPESLKPAVKTQSQGRQDSDEHYVIDLCDEVLNLKASRQHTFDFLLGDLHKDGVKRTPLPVDAYYKSLNLVVEFMERQHTEKVAFFDKPDVMTVSGVSRGEQRKIYDERRKELIPKNGLNLVIIPYDAINLSNQKKIIRNRNTDIKVVKAILNEYNAKD
jgi:hypothetical protein